MITQSEAGNQLLRRLSADDFSRLAPHLSMIDMPVPTVLQAAHTRIDTVYFLTSGMASVVRQLDRKQQIEIGVYGAEGVSGTALLLGVDQTPHDHFMQIDGAGLRLSAERFEEFIAHCPRAHTLFLKYAHVFNMQTSETAVANGIGVLEKRLARWLLMCQDRVPANQIKITHEFLSTMLGVRRAGVTEAINAIEGKDVIRARRGLVTVLDRAKLVDLAGIIYGAPEAEYARLFGDPSLVDKQP